MLTHYIKKLINKVDGTDRSFIISSSVSFNALFEYETRILGWRQLKSII